MQLAPFLLLGAHQVCCRLQYRQPEHMYWCICSTGQSAQVAGCCMPHDAVRLTRVMDSLLMGFLHPDESCHKTDSLLQAGA